MSEIQVNQTEEIKEEEAIILPLIALKGMTFFPGMGFYFDISRESSLIALEVALRMNRRIFLVEQKFYSIDELTPKDFYHHGCYAEIIQKLAVEGEPTRVMVEVKERGKIKKVVQSDPFFLVETEPIIPIDDHPEESAALVDLINKAFEEYLMLTNSSEEVVVPTIDFVQNPNFLVDLIAANLDLRVERSNKLLKERSTYKRLNDIYHYLIEEIDFIKIEKNIDARVRDELDKNQREFVLREQMRIIQDELGEDEESQIKKYYTRLNELNPPQIVREKVESELVRLKKMSNGNSESGVIEAYIDWILDLPWNISDELNIDINDARKILNEDHYGLDKVKERILEYLSVLKLTDSLRSPIICLVGAPGVGKTSIAKSIARATGRKYVRISLGGLRDEAEIRGHRRTYLGSIPGRIISHLKTVKTNNPLILLDEIDKLGQDFKGDPAAALLEVLDPEQNNTFTDNYLELPFDLSNILFITTANSLATIPEPLLDRMEVIEVNGYVESEKLKIAQKYLIPEVLKEHGLTNKQLRIHKDALQDLISYYTRESGVRELKRKISQICRIAAKKIVENNEEAIVVDSKNLEEFLGKKLYLFDKAEKEGSVGLVTGLAWTSVGGETLQIEVNFFPGNGKIMITGQLGDVMQESAQAALSFIRSQSKKLGIEDKFFSENDIHIHVPEGAVPKDGPSAGITMATALLSAFLDKPVDSKLAMTGEITLRGRVLPIGGLREKLAAAHRAGIKKIIFPIENQNDLDDVPEEITKSFELHPVKNMNEVINIVFGDLNESK